MTTTNTLYAVASDTSAGGNFKAVGTNGMVLSCGSCSALATPWSSSSSGSQTGSDQGPAGFFAVTAQYCCVAVGHYVPGATWSERSLRSPRGTPSESWGRRSIPRRGSDRRRSPRGLRTRRLPRRSAAPPVRKAAREYRSPLPSPTNAPRPWAAPPGRDSPRGCPWGSRSPVKGC